MGCASVIYRMKQSSNFRLSMHTCCSIKSKLLFHLFTLCYDKECSITLCRPRLVFVKALYKCSVPSSYHICPSSAQYVQMMDSMHRCKNRFLRFLLFL